MSTSGWSILNCNPHFTKTIVFFFFFVSVFLPTLLLQPASARQNTKATDQDFPIYPSIKSNVDFWIDIFTKFSGS